MKHAAVFLAAVTACMMLAGCSSLQTAVNFNGREVVTSGKAIAHVSAVTHGLYLFGLPLVTGSGSDTGMPAFGDDSVTVSCVTAMVTRKAQELKGSKVIDLVTRTSSFGLFFYYRSAYASGTVVK